MTAQPPFLTIRSRRPAAGFGPVNGFGPASSEFHARSATHDISRTSFHVQDIQQFATRVETSAARAFPNRGRTSQRYKSVQSLLLHWVSDDLFVLPELEDLEECLRNHYMFGTDKFSIPSENSHLELMMRVGQLIKEHEDEDTLFIIYYGGHARIDDSRQSTWSATREADSPWLQWSAIQTLLERSKSDVLILLDCCAGAASATFPTGNSITETISASSWDAIAPDPGRHSFTHVLIQVLNQWRMRAFSAAMLHAEILARLKHPRPIDINGTLYEARSTPVHFMMTSNHRAPSIELSRTVSVIKEATSLSESGQKTATEAPPTAESSVPAVPAVPTGPEESAEPAELTEVVSNGLTSNEPTDNVPHVMISLALEDDQRLDIHAWEQWLTAFPAMAKYVKIQGVFKSHSTLLLVSMPVTVWDMLPEDQATSFVAFIRSNNVMTQRRQSPPVAAPVPAGPGAREPSRPDSQSFMSDERTFVPEPAPGDDIPIPKARRFASHVDSRLESYYNDERYPNNSQKVILASNLGIEAWDLDVWFYHRRQKDEATRRLAAMSISDRPLHGGNGPRMILPADLGQLLDMSSPGQTLLFDLRSPGDYGRSHIHGAVNLRVPRSFLQVASLDMVERAIPDEQGRTAFSHRQKARCLVFYAKDLEFPSECPGANLILEKLLQSGWSGRCFILKGHYREFSGSFDKYIISSRMTQEAQHWVRDQRQAALNPAILAANQDLYTGWLSQVEAQDLARPAATSTAWSAERSRALESHEQELEAEFQVRFGELYRKAMELHPETSRRPSDSYESDGKAPMVEPLVRGLDKIREAQRSRESPPGTTSYEPEHSKLDDDHYYERRQHQEHDLADEYVDVGQIDEASVPATDSRRRRDDTGQLAEERVRRGGRGGGFLQAFRRT